MRPMFTLYGTVVNVFTAPKGVSKKTGEEFGGQDKVQILGDIPLDNGHSRKDLVTLTTDQGEVLQGLQGQEVTLPVAFYSSKGTVAFYIPKGHQITPKSTSRAV